MSRYAQVINNSNLAGFIHFDGDTWWEMTYFSMSKKKYPIRDDVRSTDSFDQLYRSYDHFEYEFQFIPKGLWLIKNRFYKSEQY